MRQAGPLDGHASLIYNEDCTSFFFAHDFDRGDDPVVALRRYLDRVAAAGPGLALCNINARRTIHASACWESFWDGLAEDGGSAQARAAGAAPAAAERYGRAVRNMRCFHRLGLDYPGLFLDLCRARGMAPWISLRMNDVHHGDQPGHPFHGRLWRERPDLLVESSYEPYFRHALDWRHEAVRGHYLALVDEVLDRWPGLAGLELDFMREPYLFTAGAEDPAVLTDAVAAVRERCERLAARRGQAMFLGVRAPADPRGARLLGIDAAGWARAGLVDLVTACPRWASLDGDLALGDWREALAGAPVVLAGGIEVLCRSHPGQAPAMATPAQALGAAQAVRARGADAVYLFNYFPVGHPGWPQADYVATLRCMGDAVTLAGAPRVHALTYRDIAHPAEGYRPPLPARAGVLDWAPTVGRIPAGLQVVIEAGFVPSGAAAAPPAIVVGGSPCRLTPEVDERHGLLVRRYLPIGGPLLERGRMPVQVRWPGDGPELALLEVRLVPGDTP